MRKEKKKKTMIVAIGLLVAIVGVCIAWKGYRYYNASVVDLGMQKKEILYIPTGATYQTVKDSMNRRGWIADEDVLDRMAGLMSYTGKVKPGRYEIENGMSARSLLNMLRSGNQKPVRITFNNIRTVDKLASVVSRHLEADSTDLVAAMTDEAVVREMGLNSETRLVIYLPDTYEIWWNTSPEDFVERMKKEYDTFWTEERRAKAEEIGLTPTEVSILASIVEEETNKADEYPIIAKIYLNRLKQNWPLQACPTLKYAMGDMTIRRVLKRDMEIDSPYNTYKNRGLPPGPIRIPSKTVIDAVLNPAEVDYMFMCAKADGSGRHSFARTQAEHNRNAEEYHRLLDGRRIYR